MNAVENESQLVIEACHGSIPAFESLVSYYEPRIRRVLYGLTQDVQLSQDLCQETFLAAYQALPRMHGETLHFSAWLYRIALNLLHSEWRRRKHMMLVPFSSPHRDNSDAFDEPIEDVLLCEDPFEERVVQRDLLQRILAQLPDASALCLQLDAEGFSYCEIAEILHDTLPAVRSRISRARRTFQRLYSDL